MDFTRIQDKIISWRKIEETEKRILELRALGLSQQEVADRLGIDRTFISRLEGIGELRKGQTIACVGFPIINKVELEELLSAEGVDFTLLMTEKERLDFVNLRSGKELLNDLMSMIAQVRRYEVAILIGSDERLRLMQGVLDCETVLVEIGHSPITEDKWVDPAQIKRILKYIKSAR